MVDAVNSEMAIARLHGLLEDGERTGRDGGVASQRHELLSGCCEDEEGTYGHRAKPEEHRGERDCMRGRGTRGIEGQAATKTR